MDRHAQKICTLAQNYGVQAQKASEWAAEMFKERTKRESLFVVGDIVSFAQAPNSKYMILEIKEDIIILQGMRNGGTHKVIRYKSDISLCEDDLILIDRDVGMGLIYG